MKSYGKMRYIPNRNIWSIYECEPHVAIKLKALFESIPKTSAVPFFLKNTMEMCRNIDWFLDRYPMEMIAEDRILLKRGKREHIKLVNDMEEILVEDYVPREKITFKNGELRKYQQQAVELHDKNKRLLLGDDLGLGKTISALGTLVDPKKLPALIVVPTHLPDQWKRELDKFLDLDVHAIHTRKPYGLRKADVYICKYSCLTGWVDVFTSKMNFKSVIFDEIHGLRREESEKYKAAKQIVRNIEYRLGLSATPIYNHGDEIYNVVSILKENALGTKGEFLREWTSNNKVVDDPKALGAYLRENFLFLRRTRKEVGRELPQVNRIVHTVDYDKREMQNFMRIAEELAKTMTTSKDRTERMNAAGQLDIRMRQMTGIAKAKYVAEYVKILLANGEPVVLSGWHRDVYGVWLDELAEYNPVMYTGSETQKEKKEAFDKFLAGESQVFIISLRSGEGLDGLQERSSIVVIGELDWTAAAHNQLIGRLNRDGQKEQVTAIYLVSETGSDPLIQALLGLKASQLEGIINPFAAPTKQFSDQRRVQLLAQRVLNKQIKI